VIPKSWHCVITCETYQIAYLGTDPERAAALHSQSTFLAEGATLGEAVRRASFGAARLTAKIRNELNGGPPKRQGPARKSPEDPGCEQ
jgi:hypothetical protein